MTTIAVLDKAGKFIKTIQAAEDKKEFEGQEVTYLTKKQFKENDLYKSWDEMIGKVKVVEGDGKAAEGGDKPAKAPVAELTGAYHLLKPLPACPDDHPKKPIWVAIEANNNGTCEAAKEACPKENPKRKTNGVYTFASEFRYFLKAGYIALGDAPEGHDHTKVEAKPAKEKRAKAKKDDAKADATPAASDAAKNESGEGEQKAA